VSSLLPSIEFVDIQLRRGNRTLFTKPLTMRSRSGHINILAGPNGSGKSSMMDIIALRAAAPSGAIIHRVGHSKGEDIAYLPQQFWDVLDIRIDDLLQLAAPLQQRHIPTQLHSSLSRARKELGQLSGGQRQLLLFWLVSSQPLSIYVYDEPFRHLDNSARVYVTNAIETQIADGKLVFLSEHSPSTHWSFPCNRLMIGTAGTAAA
jgi:ABC-type multidrug transport system ATPase subunit